MEVASAGAARVWTLVSPEPIAEAATGGRAPVAGAVRMDAARVCRRLAVSSSESQDDGRVLLMRRGVAVVMKPRPAHTPCSHSGLFLLGPTT